MKQAPIVLLDEATSALDSATEAQVGHLTFLFFYFLFFILSRFVLLHEATSARNRAAEAQVRLLRQACRKRALSHPQKCPIPPKKETCEPLVRRRPCSLHLVYWVSLFSISLDLADCLHPNPPPNPTTEAQVQQSSRCTMCA